LDATFPRAQTSSDKAWVSAEIGTGNIFLRINGTTGTLSYQFSVAIDPPPPFMPDGKVTLSQYMEWTSMEGPMFFTILDPQQSYTVTVTNIGSGQGPDARRWLNIQSFETWQVGNVTLPDEPATTTNGTTNGGKDAGGAKESNNSIPIIVGCVVSRTPAVWRSHTDQYRSLASSSLSLWCWRLSSASAFAAAVPTRGEWEQWKS
jgi:hypothetical protein